MPKRPNLLFVITDDQRFNTIRALGNPDIITPNLDALAAAGTAFTHAHLPGGTSGAVCVPARAMILTGRTLFHLERDGSRIPSEHVTLGECLQRAGYQTYGIGKWHNSGPAFSRCFAGGDEIFLYGMGDHWNVPVCDYDPTGQFAHRYPFVRDPLVSNKVEYQRCDHYRHGVHSTDVFCDAAVRFLRERRDDRPFFLYTALTAPHDPRTPPDRFRAMYPPDKIPLPENFLTEHRIDTGALHIRDEMLAAFPRDPTEITRHLAEYYAMITHLDEGLGRVLAVLRETDQWDNTIIVFTADHGLAVGQHGLLGKQNLYDHSVRIPLLIAGPGLPAGQRREALVYTLDLYRTLGGLLGVGLPDSVEGCDFGSCFHNSAHRVREHLYLAYCATIRGVRTARYKLIEYFQGETQLFDLVADPLEKNNLVAQPFHATTLATLRGELRGLRDEWDDRRHPLGADFWNARSDLA